MMMVVFLFPANTSPGSQSMNYAVVVFCKFIPSGIAFFVTLHSIGGVLILATIYFYCPKYGAKYWFKGPTKTIEVRDSGSTTIIDEKEAF